MSNPKEFERIGGEAYSILRQFFEIDRDIPLNGRVLYSELLFFESGHDLPTEHIPRAVDWLQKYLK